MSFKYVIIGGSAGGVGAVEAIREIDKRGSLAVIAEEPVPQYSKPMISEYVGEGVRLEEILYRPIEFWEENSVNLFSGRKAFMVDVQAREVTLEDNSKVYFEKLLIATGGRPIVPKIAGVDRRGVYTFTSLIDVRRLVDGLADAGHIVIVGGGLIGVSLAEALVKLRKDVTIVELKDRILSLILDAEGSSLVAHRVEQAGVKIITGRSVREILSRKGSKSQVGGVLLDNGTELSCGVVVFAIGVTPRIDMISPNQVKVNRGVVVDRYMATSAPGVYACGDAAEAFDFTWEESRLLPLWPLAYIGGRVAGSNMAGVRTVYQGGTQMSALNYFGLPVISIGVVNPPEDETYEIISSLDREKRTYRKIVLKNNTLRGVILVGKIDNAGVIFDLLKNKVDVSEFKDRILSEDFGLIHLTEPLRREMLRRN